MLVSSPVSSTGKDSPHSHRARTALMVFPALFFVTRVTARGGGLGGSLAVGDSANDSPSGLRAERGRMSESRVFRLAWSIVTTKSKLLWQLGQVTRRSVLTGSIRTW